MCSFQFHVRHVFDKSLNFPFIYPRTPAGLPWLSWQFCDGLFQAGQPPPLKLWNGIICNTTKLSSHNCILVSWVMVRMWQKRIITDDKSSNDPPGVLSLGPVSGVWGLPSWPGPRVGAGVALSHSDELTPASHKTLPGISPTPFIFSLIHCEVSVIYNPIRQTINSRLVPTIS